MNIPALLILLRLVLIPVFLILFFGDWEYARAGAVVVFTVAAMTDLFDGIIARKYNQMTNFVKLMDPLADKLLICSALIALVQTHEIAAWFVILIVCRDFIITGFRMFAAAQGRVLGAVISGKFNTCFQMLLIIFILAGFNSVLIQTLMWIVVALTLISTTENFVRNQDILKKIKLK